MYNDTEPTMIVHDEVCGMDIDAESAAEHVRFQGSTYYFCSSRCARKFEEHPDRYVPVGFDGGNVRSVRLEDD